MGTAGPLRLAGDILDDGSGDPFFVLNRHAWNLQAILQPAYNFTTAIGVSIRQSLFHDADLDVVAL